MTPSSIPQTRTVIPRSNFHDRGPDFVRWILAQLKLELIEGDGAAMLSLGEGDRAAFAGRESVEIQLGEDQGGVADGGAESIQWGSRFGQWLLARIKSAGPALHARPSGEPLAVNDIMATMFAAYEVEGGNTHLAGCELTDHPFVRLTFAGSDNLSVTHVFVAPDGSTVSDELVRRLGLDDVVSIAEAAPRLGESALRSLVSAGRRIAIKQSTERDPDAIVAEPLAVTVIWIRHVDGHLQFTVGDASATHDFSGWAKMLSPQPFVAKGSGASTFRLAATDDGRIDAAEEVAVCEQSGRRTLRQDLVECRVTGRHVLPEFTDPCSVTGLPALKSEFAVCPQCRQRVSKAAFPGGGEQPCQACQQLSKVRKDDPRLAWLLGEHPGLDRWNRWQLSETETVYITQAASFTKRLLAVVDKETLAVRYLATGGLMNSGWAEVTGAAREELLQ